MQTFQMFLASNEVIAEYHRAAIERLESLVLNYEKDNRANLDFSVAALSEIFFPQRIGEHRESRDVPLLIEMLCNLDPPILTKELWYMDGGEFEEINESDVALAHSRGYFENPISGEPDYDYKGKVGMRFVLSSEVLSDE